MRELCAAAPDRRTGRNARPPMADLGMAAFAVMFPQYPFFLSAQKHLEVVRDIVEDLARCARARWKVKNNAFGILEDSFNLKHTFGRGRYTLVDLLAMFNIISLLMQNACDLRCEHWKAARARLAARYRMPDHIRTVLVDIVFQDWSAILRAIAAADLPEKPPRPTTASPQTKLSAVPLEIRPGKEKIENELIMRITGETAVYLRCDSRRAISIRGCGPSSRIPDIIRWRAAACS